MRAAFVLSFALAAAAAHADETPLERARSLAAEAQSDYDLGHYETALKRFEDLYKLRPVAGVLFNIAQCHRKLGRLKEAANLYRSFLVHADPESREAAKAQELLAQVEAAIKQQDALAKAAPQGTAPLPAATEQAKPAVAVDPPKPAAPAAATPWPPPSAPQQKPPPPPPVSHKAAYVLAGVAVAAAGGGAFLGMQSKNAGNALAGSTHTRAEAESLADEHEGKAIVANLLFGLAGALALGAVIAW